MNLKKETFIFFLLSIGLFLYFGLFSTIEHAPFGMHQGAQADRASIAYNYYKESMNFFEPRVMENRSMNGITGMEFPIISYLTACLYTLFGYNPFWYRLIEALLFLAGQYATWKIAAFFIQKLWHRILFHILWVSSPILIFYSNNFLPETPALSLSLLAWYQFFRWYFGIQPKRSQWGLILFGTLAALIKITYLIPFIAITIILIAHKQLQLSHLPQRRQLLLSFSIPLILVFSWYYYARFLTDISYNLHFLQKINPPESISEFWENSRYALNTWIDGIYPREFLILMLLLWVLTLQKHWKSKDLLLAISVLLFLGFLGIFILFNRQFRYHDYYFISAFPYLFFTLLLLYKHHLNGRFVFTGIGGILSLIGLFIAPFIHANHTQKQVKATYTKGDYYCQNILDNIEDIEPTRSFLNREFKAGEIIVAFDPSPNTFLYYLGRQGIRIAPDFEEILTVGIIQSKIDEKTLAQPSIIINKYFDLPQDHYIHTLIEGKPIFQTGEIWIFNLNKSRFNF